jgi:hypothetical protein
MMYLENSQSSGKEPGKCGSRIRQSPSEQPLAQLQPKAVSDVFPAELEKGGHLAIPHTVVSHTGGATLGQSCVSLRPHSSVTYSSREDVRGG